MLQNYGGGVLVVGSLSVVCRQAEKVHELNEEIGKLLAKSEQLGAEGNVDEAQKVLQEVEKVRSRKRDAEVSAAPSVHAGALTPPHFTCLITTAANHSSKVHSGNEKLSLMVL